MSLWVEWLNDTYDGMDCVFKGILNDLIWCIQLYKVLFVVSVVIFNIIEFLIKLGVFLVLIIKCYSNKQFDKM